MNQNLTGRSVFFSTLNIIIFKNRSYLFSPHKEHLRVNKTGIEDKTLIPIRHGVQRYQRVR
jgi:hypothetical protein